jgi:hypothetical protein
MPAAQTVEVTQAMVGEVDSAVSSERQVRSAPTAVLKISGDPLADFSAWTADYLQAPPAEKARLLEQGVKLAQERRPVFKALIMADPREAIQKAVPMVLRQKLPPEIVALLEERVNATGALHLRMGVPTDGQGTNHNIVKQRRAVFGDGKAYNAHVYGRREVVTSVAAASLNGVALDSEMAVNEQPSRTLEIGEVPTAGKEAVVDCPVSGKQVFESPQSITEEITVTTPAWRRAVRSCSFAMARTSSATTTRWSLAKASRAARLATRASCRLHRRRRWGR